MTVETNFSWEWKKLADKSCLHVKPRDIADDRRWIAYFEEVAGTFQDGEAFVFVDVREIEERISLEGFKGIIGTFKRQGVESAVFAVVSTDEFHNLTAGMFKTLADMRDFELRIKVFLDEGLARAWMLEQIGQEKAE